MKMNLPLDSILDFLIVRAALEKYHAQEVNKVQDVSRKRRNSKDELQEGYLWGIEELLAKMDKMEEQIG